MSAGESFLSKCWSCCACLSTFTSNGKVDMLCNQSRSAWWSIKEKKKETTTTTNQKTGCLGYKMRNIAFSYFCLCFVLKYVTFPLYKKKRRRKKKRYFLRARFMPWNPLESCFKSLSIVQDDLKDIYRESTSLFLKMWKNYPNRSPYFIASPHSPPPFPATHPPPPPPPPPSPCSKPSVKRMLFQWNNSFCRSHFKLM